MEPHVHKILEEVGAAKGINKSEVLALITLWNTELFESFCTQLHTDVKQGKHNHKEVESTIIHLKEARKKAQNASSKYFKKVKEAQEKAIKKFVTHQITKKEEEIRTIENNF